MGALLCIDKCYFSYAHHSARRNDRATTFDCTAINIVQPDNMIHQTKPLKDQRTKRPAAKRGDWPVNHLSNHLSNHQLSLTPTPLTLPLVLWTILQDLAISPWIFNFCFFLAWTLWFLRNFYKTATKTQKHNSWAKQHPALPQSPKLSQPIPPCSHKSTHPAPACHPPKNHPAPYRNIPLNTLVASVKVWGPNRSSRIAGPKAPYVAVQSRIMKANEVSVWKIMIILW